MLNRLVRQSKLEDVAFWVWAAYAVIRATELLLVATWG